MASILQRLGSSSRIATQAPINSFFEKVTHNPAIITTTTASESRNFHCSPALSWLIKESRLNVVDDSEIGVSMGLPCKGIFRLSPNESLKCPSPLCYLLEFNVHQLSRLNHHHHHLFRLYHHHHFYHPVFHLNQLLSLVSIIIFISHPNHLSSQSSFLVPIISCLNHHLSSQSSLVSIIISCPNHHSSQSSVSIISCPNHLLSQSSYCLNHHLS